MYKKELTGYPSVDKPWLKYYSEEAINAPIPKCTVYEYLWNANKDHTEDVAITYFDRNITYSELFENIDKVTSAFANAGIKHGDIVTMCTVSTPETIYAFYALSRLGAISNLIDLRSDIEELNRYIVGAESKIVLALDLVASKIQEAIVNTQVEKVILLSASDSFVPVKRILYKVLQTPKIKIGPNMMPWASFIKKYASTASIKSQTSANDVVLMTHTSGTTGVPKGVMLSNLNINAVAFQYALGMPHSRQQKYLDVTPPFVAFGVCVAIHLPLGLGLTCIPIIQFDSDNFYDYLKKYNPNHFSCTPANLEALIRDERYLDLSYISVPATGGDYIGQKLEDNINQYLKGRNCKVELIKGYGMTEVSSSACTTKSGCNKYGSVGVPLVKMTISIFQPETNKELTYNEEGEICFTGPNVMIGYFKNQAETNRMIKKHSDGTLWVHSGDIGYMDEDGFLFVIDRMKRIIHLSNGLDLLPSKIERRFSEIPEVSSCAVLAYKNAYGKTGAKAYVVLNNSNLALENLYEYGKTEIPEEFCLEKIEIIDHLPLTPVGKVDYRALEKEVQ